MTAATDSTGASTAPTSAQRELDAALADGDAFDAWLTTRGYTPADTPLDADTLPATLDGARVLTGDAPGAPTMLAIWRPTMTAQSAHGRTLREIQRAANALRTTLLAQGAAGLAPELGLIACPAFLVVFPIDTDPFARRQRFTRDSLARDESRLADAFRNLDATRITAPPAEAPGAPDALPAALPDEFADDDDLAALFGDLDTPQWRVDLIYAAEQFDRLFVDTMADRRRALVATLLDPARRDLLRQIADCLLPAGAPRQPGGLLDLAALLRPAATRNLIVAVADTLLLRVVLRRFLEAQYGTPTAEAKAESRTFAFGSYDDALDTAVDIDPEVLADDIDRIHRDKAHTRGHVITQGTQGDLFGNPATLKPDRADDFRSDYRARGDHYQRTAGGDLHLGRVAEAADLFEDALVADDPAFIACLLNDTRADRYSFHWADLDPKSFQRFYEQTIGTDIRLDIDGPPGAEPTVRVVPFHRARKEQGAFYTGERLCAWLVERTLGRWLDDWLDALQTLCRDDDPRARVPRVRAHLDRLLELRIIDPTCGGGIFLRAAFQRLTPLHRPIVETLAAQLTPADHRAVITDRHALFAPDADDARWEWYILLHMLYGVDVDMKAINVASNLLTLSALAYKPGALRFPSFINQNLKRGNALVVPFTGDRAAFSATWKTQIAQLIELRAALRDPALDDDTWRAHHAAARALTDRVVAAQIGATYADRFPDLDRDALRARVEQVGVFLYEIEFPEAFYQPDGTPRPNPGFDIVLGNPPWEEPAAESKHFLSEFDPEYRKLDKKASLRRQAELLDDPAILARWDDFQRSVEDYKTLLTTPGTYQHQRARVHGKIPGAHTNLYKYATERAWHLLADDGRAGLVLDGGLWHDVSATGLRRLLLGEGRVDAIIGFNNNRGLFPEVHRSYKFAATVFTKLRPPPGGTSETEQGQQAKTLRAVFMRTELADLDTFDQAAAALPIATLTADRDGPWKVPEVRSAEQWHAFRAFADVPRLKDDAWQLDTLNEEINAGRQRGFFEPQKPGLWPVVQGTQFNLFGVHQGEEPDAWFDPGGGLADFVRARQEKRIYKAIADTVGGSGTQEQRARAWLQAVTGSSTLSEDWLRLDWDGYRIAWRDIARSDDRRTLIAGVLPPRVACSHTAPFIRPYTLEVQDDGLAWTEQHSAPALLYLAGMLASFACDATARTRLAKTHMTKKLFLATPVPPWRDTPTQHRIAELCCDLTCLPATPERPWADYRALAAELGRDPATHGLTDPAERRDAEVELNALAAELYGLDRKAFRYLMDELFMTPRYRDEHAQLRDDIAREMP